MSKNNNVVKRGIGGASYNVYCVYSDANHKMLCATGAHDRSLKDFQSEESLAEKLIAGTAFVAFIVLVLLVGAL